MDGKSCKKKGIVDFLTNAFETPPPPLIYIYYIYIYLFIFIYIYIYIYIYAFIYKKTVPLNSDWTASPAKKRA